MQSSSFQSNCVLDICWKTWLTPRVLFSFRMLWTENKKKPEWTRTVCFKDEHVKLKFIDLEDYQKRGFSRDPSHCNLSSTHLFPIHKVQNICFSVPQEPLIRSLTSYCPPCSTSTDWGSLSGTYPIKRRTIGLNLYLAWKLFGSFSYLEDRLCIWRTGYFFQQG